MRLRYGTPQEAGMSSERVQRVTQLAERWVADGVTPSLVILAARRGIIVLHEAFGRLAPEPDAPPLPRDAIFGVASLTKPITATAVMQLVEDGLLGLNRPVPDYIPEFQGEGRDAVMVHHLLTHTSGFRDEDLWPYLAERLGTVVPPPMDQTQHPVVAEELLIWYGAPQWKPAGAEMAYCNFNYALLGEIVRRVSRQSLPSFVRERIFEPLGMNDSHFAVPPPLEPRIVKRPPIPTPAFFKGEFREAPRAYAGVYSTALDMATFGQMLLNRGRYSDKRILSLASVAAMTRNQIPGVGSYYNLEYFPEASWGYGWDVREDKKALREGSLSSGRTFLHGGASGVYLWIDPVNNLVGVYFSVKMYEGERVGSPLWRGDYFVNAVTAAIIDD